MASPAPILIVAFAATVSMSAGVAQNHPTRHSRHAVSEPNLYHFDQYFEDPDHLDHHKSTILTMPREYDVPESIMFHAREAPASAPMGSPMASPAGAPGGPSPSPALIHPLHARVHEALDDADDALDKANAHLPPGGLKRKRRTTTEEPEWHEDNMDEFEEAQEEANKDAERTVDKVQKADVKKMARADYDELMTKLMPGYSADQTSAKLALVTVVISWIWFIIWLKCIYENDRPEHTRRWDLGESSINPHGWSACQDNAQLSARRMDSPTSASTPRGQGVGSTSIGAKKTDIVLVFHHPNYEFPDAEQEVDIDELQHVIQKPELFERLSQATGVKVSRLHHHHETVSWMDAFSVSGKSKWEKEELVGSSASEDEEEGGMDRERQTSSDPRPPCTQWAVRKAMMQDIFAVLPTLGFDVMAFTSVDDDEIFVCISLSDEKIATDYMMASGTRLQIHQEVVAKMGIDQPPEECESSPPFITYDPTTAEHLQQAGALETTDDRELFKCFYGRVADGSIVSSRERIRIIIKELSKILDLDAAIADGFMIDWYPTHNRTYLRRLESVWGQIKLMLDLTFVQPIPLIREYFGSRVAFLFAWNGLVCKGLVALLPMSLLAELVVQMQIHVLGMHVNDHRQVLAPCLIIIVWMRIVQNLWAREEAYFLELWEMDPRRPDSMVHSKFHGFRSPSIVDHSKEELTYPVGFYAFRQSLAGLVTAGFCIAVFCGIYVWIQIFKEELNSNPIASIVLSLQIKVAEFIYSFIISRLTDWENHKYVMDHYNSFLLKQFLFHFVNNYSAFLLLALRTDVGINTLRYQLTMVQGILAVCAIAVVGVQIALVEFKLWYETYQMRKSGNQRERAYLEEQSKFAVIGVQEQIDMTTQLMISLGFVLMFGCIAPIMIPFALCVFAITLRTQAKLMVVWSKRMMPSKMIGIGGWTAIIKGIQSVGILLGGMLMVLYGELFEGAVMVAKVTGVLFFIVAVAIVIAAVDVMVPPLCTGTRLLHLRRHHVEKELIREVAQGMQIERKIMASHAKNVPRGAHEHTASQLSVQERKKQFKKMQTMERMLTDVAVPDSHYATPIMRGEWIEVPYLSEIRDIDVASEASSGKPDPMKEGRGLFGRTKSAAT